MRELGDIHVYAHMYNYYQFSDGYVMDGRPLEPSGAGYEHSLLRSIEL